MGQAYGVLLQQAKACFDVGDFVNGLKLAADARDIAQTADQLTALIRCVERMAENTTRESPKAKIGIIGEDDEDDDGDDGDGGTCDSDQEDNQDVQILQNTNFATCDFLVQDHQKLVVDSEALLHDLRAKLELATSAPARITRAWKGRGSVSQDSLRSLAFGVDAKANEKRKKTRSKGCACTVM